MKMACIDKRTLNSALLIMFVFTGQTLADLPSDAFSDNTMAEIWQLSEMDHDNC